MKKNRLYILFGILALLIITNPSPREFWEYADGNGGFTSYRRANLFIFSVYKYDGDYYIGAIGNFINISYK
jgi:hypothetical protein